MLLGGDFNKKGKELLMVLSKMSGEHTGTKITVSDLNSELHYDRNEIKNLLEYLESEECVNIETIGGPFLYGHISITKKGLLRAAKQKR